MKSKQKLENCSGASFTGLTIPRPPIWTGRVKMLCSRSPISRPKIDGRNFNLMVPSSGCNKDKIPGDICIVYSHWLITPLMKAEKAACGCDWAISESKEIAPTLSPTLVIRWLCTEDLSPNQAPRCFSASKVTLIPVSVKRDFALASLALSLTINQVFFRFTKYPYEGPRLASLVSQLWRASKEPVEAASSANQIWW